MPVTNYDCGDLSDVVITTDFFTGIINITINGVTGDVYIKKGKVISFLCSGQMSIDAPLNSIHVFLSSVSLTGVWTENFLMGLAGIVCASLFTYVFVKYAV